MLGFHGLLGPISGGLVNRFGTRVVCVTGSLVSSLGFFFAALVQNVPCLMLTYGNLFQSTQKFPSLPKPYFCTGFMGGFGTGLINVSSIVAVNKYFDAKREIATGMNMFVVEFY